MCCCVIKTLSVTPLKSLVIFGNLRQSSENAWKCLQILQNNFGKRSEIFEKSSKTTSLLGECNAVMSTKLKKNLSSAVIVIPKIAKSKFHFDLPSLYCKCGRKITKVKTPH